MISNLISKIAFFLILQIPIFAQEYQLTNVPVVGYSIDRFTNEIYYQHEFTGEIFKTNSTGSYHTLTEFPSVPQFSNKSHTAAYISGNNLYLHDFEKDTSYFLVNYPLGSDLLFSPSDNRILRGGDGQVTIVYYTFEDSSIHNSGITIYPEVMEWLTDTTIIYIELPNNIRVLNINDLNINTLVSYADTVTIRGLANNMNINAFAYSWEYNSAENTIVNLYYISNGVDSIIYNYLEQGTGSGIFIRSLAWERNTNKLGFIGEGPLQFLSLIYVFDYASFETNLYTDPYTIGDGYKYNLQWLNKDTIAYSDWTDGRLLFGLDLSKPVSVKESLTEIVYELDMNVYPNPFNNTTKITVNVPSLGNLSIELYNCLGESIGRKNFDYISEGNFTFDWNEIMNNKNLATGIYFINTLFNGSEFSTHKTVKLIYLK